MIYAHQADTSSNSFYAPFQKSLYIRTFQTFAAFALKPKKLWHKICDNRATLGPLVVSRFLSSPPRFTVNSLLTDNFIGRKSL